MLLCAFPRIRILQNFQRHPRELASIARFSFRFPMSTIAMSQEGSVRFSAEVIAGLDHEDVLLLAFLNFCAFVALYHERIKESLQSVPARRTRLFLLTLLFCVLGTFVTIARIGYLIHNSHQFPSLSVILVPSMLALLWISFFAFLCASRLRRGSIFSVLSFTIAAEGMAFVLGLWRYKKNESQGLLEASIRPNLISALLPLSLFVFTASVAISALATRNQLPDDLQEPLLETGTPAPDNGYASASIVDTLLFSWVSAILKLGNQRPLQVDDVPSLASNDCARASFQKFEENWRQQAARVNKKHLVAWALWDTFKGGLVLTGVLALLKTCVSYAGPILLNAFVEYISGKRLFPYEGLTLVFVLFTCKALETAMGHQFSYRSVLLGLGIRSSLVGALYAKGLKLSSKAKQSHTVGEIVNYMSTDAQRLADLVRELHNIWVLPLQIIIALAILFLFVGWAMAAGLVIMVVIMALNLTIATSGRSLMQAGMAARDKRMKATTEALNNMKVIKLYAWQNWFLKRIEGLRNDEMGHVSAFSYLMSVNIFLLWLSPLLVSVGTFGFMLWLQYPLTPGSVFAAIATFRILQEPLRSFPNVISAVTQAMVSLDRLTKFLSDEELQEDAVSYTSFEDSPKVAVEIENGNFSWEDNLVLSSINLKVKRGQRVAICGSVGSGKSSVLSAILGEMRRDGGSVTVSGSLAYVAQSAWIQNDTIQNNILFGLPFHEDRYQEAISACSLTKDLALFSHGDKTEIGERGINLSGGQKQRLQLARALYQDRDIYLLDDPFSAVDAHTGTDLFMNCILGPLVSKTVILVTHQVEFLPAVDLIVVVKDGTIVQIGKYDELHSAGTDFSSLVNAHDEALDSVDGATSAASGKSAEVKHDGICSPSERETEREASSEAEEGPKKDQSQLIQDEERETGRVSQTVYWAYLTRAFHGRLVPLLLLIQFIWQGLQIGSDWWLQYYTSPPPGAQKMSPAHFMKIYASLALGSGLFVLARSFLVAFSGLQTAQAFYEGMLRSIFTSPMAFFDSTPVGRILSRSSTDQATLDLDMPFGYGSLLAIGFSLLGIVAVTSMVTWPVVLCVGVLGYLYTIVQSYYLSSSRELSRINGITKAPIIQNFSEALAGSTTIRAFGRQDLFSRRSEDRVDSNLKVALYFAAANDWLGVRLELVGAFLLCFAALLLVVLPAGTITPGLAAISLSYGLALNQTLFYVVFIWSMIENEMVAVERIHQYSELEPEAPLEMPSAAPASDWPTEGTVEIERLQVQYREDLPLVIKGITVTLQGGQRIGVVGRTGSGKSTLVQALFRLVEPAAGVIRIDGIDITTLGLNDLRSRLSIIPQEPTLFEGTVRSNLDPIGQFTDEDIWEALEKCQLVEAVKATKDGLDACVNEGGENWSVGQRQLFCLGRALLKKSKVLLLDEATASVDTVTDAIIQSTIKANFPDSTVISIAHRIPTVVNSDNVLVLHNGELAEYGSPNALLENPGSMFAKLVAEYSNRSSGVKDMAKSSSVDQF